MDQYFVRNEPGSLNCHAEGDPKPNITWYKNGKELVLGDHQMMLLTGRLVFLLFIHTKNNKSDVGVYFCKATNIHGSAVSRNATIKAAVLRDDFRQEPTDTTKSAHSTAIFHCKPPRGEPEPQVSWLHNGKPVEINERIKIHEDGDLIISLVKTQDMGEYVCLAKNKAGERQSSPAQLTVVGLTDDMHRTIDLTPMEIVIPILLFLMILSLLLGYVRYCFRKKMQKGVCGNKNRVIGTTKVDHHTCTIIDTESQVLIEEDATSLQNAYESIASDGSETIHRNEVNDTLDRDYLSPVFDAVNSNDEENQEGQTETRSHLQANTVVAYTSNVYEEIDSHSEIKYQQLSITNFKEVVVGNTSNSNQETGSNSQLTDHLQSNTDLQGLGNSPNTYEEIDSQTHRKQIACDTHILEASETESNSQLTDHLQHNTNLQQVLRNSQNTYEEIDGHTHRKQIMYDTDILEASATVQPSSNIDTISETKLKPGYEPIYYHLGHQQDVDSPVTDSHEYETVTPITHGTLNFVVNGLSEDGYMIPCVKNSDKVSTSKSEHIECTSEETLVKQISTSNTDLKTFYSTTYEDIERNRSAQQQLETGNIPNFEELGGSYPSLFNVESSDQDSSKSGDSNTGEL